MHDNRGIWEMQIDVCVNIKYWIICLKGFMTIYLEICYILSLHFIFKTYNMMAGICNV
jgi:hypothetical protein